MSSSSAMDRMRNWPVKYDGDANTLEFIERIEEICETYERTLERPESPELRVEKSSVVANVTIGGILIKGVIDTGATRTIIKSSLQDVIPFVSEAPNISTTIRMADGTLRYSHRELVTTVRVGETHFQLPLIVLDDVVDNLTLGMDFLIKAQATLAIGESVIQFGNTVQRSKDSWSGKPFDTITNPAHDITSVRGPASSSVIENKHDAFFRQAPKEKRDNALHTRMDLPKEQRIKRIHKTPRDDIRDKVKPSEPSRKFPHFRSSGTSNTCLTNMTSCPHRNPDSVPDNDGVCLGFLIPVDSDKSDEIVEEPSLVDRGKLLPPRRNDPGWQALPKDNTVYQQLVAKFPATGKRGRFHVSRDGVWYRVIL
uniref:Peptidase A2 domain-containing protein n=1 Tax=Glossina morsitans morsitans TaxID=37546 RepID=A0A1B0GAU6_GLOMM